MSEAIAITPLKALLKFPFQGPKWRNNFVIGSVLVFAGSIVPVIPLIFVNGYILQVMRRAIEGKDLALPDWEDWGELGTDGLRMTLVWLAYLLPGIVVLVGGFLLYFVASFASPLLAVAAEKGGNEAWAGLLVMTTVFGSLAIFMLSMLVGTLLLLLGAIPLPVATANFVADDKVAAAFRLRQWWPVLRANRWGYFAAWVIVLGLMAVMYTITMIAYYSCVLCCLIPVLAAPLNFYMALICAALFGEVYREGTTMVPSN
jgi:hypothetical protein